MTYFSDFDYSVNYYDNPVVRERILHEVEEQLFEDTSETVPWDLLEDF
jgi:hypothetical protein